MIFVRKLHKWLTLVIGAQLIIWLVTGTLISFINQEEVGGSATRQAVSGGTPAGSFVELFPSSQLPIAGDSIHSIALTRILQRPVYRVEQNGAATLFDAGSGDAVRIDGQLAEAIARDSYKGVGEIIGSELFALGSDEVRDFDGPVWRVDIDDDLATRVYVSTGDGQVLAHRNSRWKLVDFLLMLHFMDYVRADSFNNPQIIIVGFGTLWIAVSGLLLVFYSFSRSDFLWLPGMESRGQLVKGTVKSAGHPGQQLTLNASLSYYASLSRRGIKLSSNCDGSGSCGLCKIHYEENVPDHTAVDREWIDTSELSDGFRLGCQHKPRQDDVVTVPDMAFQTELQWAEVLSSRWLTPLLKEIRIRPDAFLQFTPGDYLEFQIPPYEIDLEQLVIPEVFCDIWSGLAIPHSWAHSDPGDHSRTYSIATAPSQAEPQELVFTVRFSPPPAEVGALPGIGSTYMCSLQPGDRIAFRGPAGDFHLVNSDREKILIGGGAGMAPLKSMATHLLNNQHWRGKLRFWYGARNQQEILFRDTFEALAEDHANFEWEVALSDAADDVRWHGHRGLIHEVIFDNVLKHHDSLAECEFYVCGPPRMLASTRQMLRELGVSEQSVRFDDFGN